VAQDEHHASQVLATPRASNSIFIREPKALTVTPIDRPENSHAVSNAGRRLTPHFNWRSALLHAEIKRNTPMRSNPLRVAQARAFPQFCAAGGARRRVTPSANEALGNQTAPRVARGRVGKGSAPTTGAAADGEQEG
jgi:hypothetical protein